MREFGMSPAGTAGAIAIILLLVLLGEHEILRLIPRPDTSRRRSSLRVGIVPLIVVFVLVAVLRLGHIAFTHP
jgi:multisubunit Na+/H+ antiporter MnhB subunit